MYQQRASHFIEKCSTKTSTKHLQQQFLNNDPNQYLLTKRFWRLDQ